MYHLTLALAVLAGFAISAPTPAPQDGGPGADGLIGPDYNVLTCQAQSIVVNTVWNTAFITSDPSYTKYGEATQVVPLNGCAELSATFNAYFSNATPDGASMWSSIKCTIVGAPKGPDAQLHITPKYPFHELADADGVTVNCADHDDVPGGGYEESEEPKDEAGDGDQGEGEGGSGGAEDTGTEQGSNEKAQGDVQGQIGAEVDAEEQEQWQAGQEEPGR